MRTRDVGMLVALAAIWGIAFPLTRIAVPEFGPVSLIAVRVVVGVALLIPLMKARHEVLANWRPLFVLGLLNTAVPFALFAYAVVHISAGFAALLNSRRQCLGPCSELWYFTSNCRAHGRWALHLDL